MLRIAWQVNINTLPYRLLQLEELEDGYILHQQLREGVHRSHFTPLHADKYSLLNKNKNRFRRPNE
jgi:hypothetical protein